MTSGGSITRRETAIRRALPVTVGDHELANASKLSLLASMELIARTGYQAGKSPILPVFAASIGASASQSGFIVAISAATGLMTSPLIGALSDRYGRTRLLLVGTLLFAFMPLLYLWVETAGQLVALRIGHGFATAIYGPVITAAVADTFRHRTAGALGWYRSVRTSAYFLGPLLGGALLLLFDPRGAWVAVAVVSALAFVPGIMLTHRLLPTAAQERRAAPIRFVTRAIGEGIRDGRLLTLGVVQVILYAALRGNSAFLPLWGIAQGLNAGQVGVMLSLQILVTLVCQPVVGHLADRVGNRLVVTIGLSLVGGALATVGLWPGLVGFALAAVGFGLGEAAIAPTVSAAATRLAAGRNYGGRLGILEATDNIGKVLGPIAVGLLIGWLGYSPAYALAAVVVLVATGLIRMGMAGAREAHT